MTREPLRSCSPWTTMTAACLLALATTAQQVSWSRQAQGGHSFGRAVSCAAGGAVAVTGRYRSDVLLGAGEASPVLLQHPALFGNSQNFVAVYDPDGQLAWAHPITTPITGTSGDFNGFLEWNNSTSVATGGDGSVVVCGWYFPPVTFGSDTASASTLVNFPAAAGGPYPGTIINNPPTGGTFANDSRGKSLFLARYAADGTFLWARSDGGSPATDYPERVAVAADGAILMAGAILTHSWAAAPTFGLGEANETSLADTFSDSESFLAKYTTDGHVMWARSIRGGLSWAQDLCALADGSTLITGWARHDPAYALGPSLPVAGVGEPNQTALSSSPGTMCAYIARYLSDGSLAWAIQPSQVALPASIAQSFGKSICGFADGSFAVGGHFRGVMTLDAGGPNEATLTSTVDQDDLFVARFTATGSLLWARRIAAGSACPSFTTGTMASRADGSLILSGGFQGQLVFAPGAANETTLSGTAVTFLACYDHLGGLAWARPMPGADRVDNDQSGPPWNNQGSCFQGNLTSEAYLGVAAFADGSFVATSTVSTPTGAAMLLTRFRADITNLSAPTPADTNPVTVAPTNAIENGNSGIALTFATVTTPGSTSATVTAGSPTPPPPANFEIAGIAQWYELTTTATYTAPITLSIAYDETGIADESALKLLHYESGSWVDVTTSVDTVNNVIHGTASSLSPFVIVKPTVLSITASPTVVSSFGGVTTLTINTTGATPTLTTSAGTLLGTLLDLGGGAFSQVLQASPGSPSTVVTATIPTATRRLAIRFVPVDPVRSTLVADPTTTFRGAHVTLSAVPRDNLGAAVGSGRTVVFATTLGALSGPVLDLGNGSYAQTLDATTLGTAQVTASVDGLPLDATVAVTVLDPAGLGAVLGVDRQSHVHTYASIQQAVNRAVADQLGDIFLTPRSYNEIVKVQGLSAVSIQGLTGAGPVTVKGFRLDACRSLGLGYLTVEATGSGARGVVIAGGQDGNDQITLSHLLVRGTAANLEGIQVGPNVGAVTIESCVVQDCGGDGVAFARGGPFVLRDCTLTGSRLNGASVDKDATATFTRCTVTGNGTGGDARNGYGILRQRAPGGGTPLAITLLDNLLAGNRGLVVAGRSDQNLGNLDQILDATDSQIPY